MSYPVSFPRKCFYIPLLLLLILVQLSGIFTYCPLFMMFFLPSAAPLVAQMVKCLPAMPETWVPSLDQEDPLEKRMATHSSIFACRIPGQRSLVGYSPCGRKSRIRLSDFIFSSLKSTPNGQGAQNTWFLQDSTHRKHLYELDCLFSEGFPNPGIVFQMIQNGIFHIFLLTVPLPPTTGSFVPESSVLLPWAALLSPKAAYAGTSVSHIPQSSLFLQVYHVESFSPRDLCLSSQWPLSPGLYFSKQTFSPQEEICFQL